MTLIYIILALLLLCLLITVHEFGHFVAARLTGIPVNEFAIGFGPKILGWKSKKYPTTFALRVFPLGGYCSFVGEDDATGAHTDDPDAFNKQKVWKRLVTVFMGPMMNFVLAICVAIVLFALTPVVDTIPDSVYIQAVDENAAAFAAGIEVGDQIIAINAEATDLNDSESIVKLLNKHAAQMENVPVTVKRGEEIIQLTVTPQYDETLNNPYRIGVSITVRTGEPHRLNIGQSITYAWDYCIEAATVVFRTLKLLVTEANTINEVSGPVGIVTMISQSTQTYGASAFFSLLVMISINLGIMNLLPIPGLDGSRILFILLEAVRGKPIDPKKEAVVHLAGLVLLFGLMIFVTFKDVIRLFA